MPQASSSASTAFTTVDTFSHLYDRGGDKLVNGKPSFTADQAADEILRKGLSWGDKNADGKIDLSYNFLSEKPANYNAKLGIFSEFSAQQKAQAVLAMQSWADVANVTFSEGKGGDGHMTFGNYDVSTGGAAFAYLPSGGSYDGQSWYLINNQYQVNKTPDTNNYGRQTLTHEIGHTLGLSHPGAYNAGNGNPTYGDAKYAEDTRGYSLMSYWSETNTGQDSARTAAVPMLRRLCWTTLWRCKSCMAPIMKPAPVTPPTASAPTPSVISTARLRHRRKWCFRCGTAVAMTR